MALRWVAQQNHELFAAETDGHVFFTNGGLDRICYAAQDHVAYLVAVLIVEQLEVVHVHGQYRHAVSGPATAGQKPAVLVEVAAIWQLRQLVGASIRFGRLMRVDAGQSGRRLGGCAVQQPYRRFAPDIAGPARQDDRARDPPARLKRRGQRVAEAVGVAQLGGNPIGYLTSAGGVLDRAKSPRSRPDVAPERVRGFARRPARFARAVPSSPQSDWGSPSTGRSELPLA